MRSAEGSIGDCLAACICMLLMSVLLITYMDSVELINQKAAVGQIARKYILRMETYGVLSADDCIALTTELEEVGAEDIVLEGSSLSKVPYGEPICLQIRGKLRGEHDFEEKRFSTAKY